MWGDRCVAAISVALPTFGVGGGGEPAIFIAMFASPPSAGIALHTILRIVGIPWNFHGTAPCLWGVEV